MNNTTVKAILLVKDLADMQTIMEFDGFCDEPKEALDRHDFRQESLRKLDDLIERARKIVKEES